MSTTARLAALAAAIERGHAALGRAVAWCALAMIAVQVVVVTLRYGFGLGSIWLTETVLYAHATLILMASAWTLAIGGHVRVDIFYARAGLRARAWIDLLGALVFLLPFAAMLVALSLPYVGRSWAIFERSREASGLPLVFALKTLIPLFALTLLLQGVAQAIRAGLVLAAAPIPPLAGEAGPPGGPGASAGAVT